MMKRKDWIFIQDSAPSHRANLVQNFLSEKLNKRFVKYSEWPPTSLDCKPLDYDFWEKVQRKVYGKVNEKDGQCIKMLFG